jgi:hypothetical protein
MKCPNRLPIILGGVIGAVALVCCFLLPNVLKDGPDMQGTEPTGNSINIQDSNDTTDPDIVVPDNTDPADPTVPSNGDPFVEDSEDVEIKDVSKEDSAVLPGDKVIDTGKDDTEEPKVEQGEIRNDAVLEEKEDATHDKEISENVIVEKEEVTVGNGKDNVHGNEDEVNNDGDANKNGSEYTPSAGGDNPFDDDTETEIKDTPVEDLIGEGEDRPGGGIHF